MSGQINGQLNFVSFYLCILDVGIKLIILLFAKLLQEPNITNKEGLSVTKRVIIIGGGVAGMSAAHELIKKGFAVEVLEANSVPGGKARSVDVANTGKDGRKDLPGEHGFRFFPHFYRNLPETMKEIPLEGSSKSAFDNLVQGSRELIARANGPNILGLARFPRNIADFKTLLTDLFAPIGLSDEEKHFAAMRLWQIATSCDARWENDYEKIGWWEYVEADRFSENYRALFAIGLTRTLVAARARTASTKVGGSILLQLVYGMLIPGASTDRLLNNPTNPAWIDPWLAYLRKQGVNYHLNSPVSHIECGKDGEIKYVKAMLDGVEQKIKGDYYLSAVPVEVMANLLTPEILQNDNTLATIKTLSEDVSWMNGMQFYLTSEVNIDHGHAMFVDAPWAITSISQLQFWDDFDISKYGDGTIKSIISVDISNWDDLGILEHGKDKKRKSAKQCTREEIKDEVWAQIKQGLNIPGEPPVLKDEDLKTWYIDSDIEPVDYHSDDTLWKNAEPLLVNKINTWQLRPETHTRIPNFFLAADYLKTDVSLATMESANEAARRAVNGIIDASGSKAPYSKVYPLKRPWVLAPLRYADKLRYKRGLPWNGKLDLSGMLKHLFRLA